MMIQNIVNYLLGNTDKLSLVLAAEIRHQTFIVDKSFYDTIIKNESLFNVFEISLYNQKDPDVLLRLYPENDGYRWLEFRL